MDGKIQCNTVRAQLLYVSRWPDPRNSTRYYAAGEVTLPKGTYIIEIALSIVINSFLVNIHLAVGPVGIYI